MGNYAKPVGRLVDLSKNHIMECSQSLGIGAHVSVGTFKTLLFGREYYAGFFVRFFQIAGMEFHANGGAAIGPTGAHSPYVALLWFPFRLFYLEAYIGPYFQWSGGASSATIWGFWFGAYVGLFQMGRATTYPFTLV